MKRLIDYDLQKWVTQRDRMPLIVRGPRHVGKTYSIRKMAKNYFNDVVEVNFELMPQIARIFEKDLDAKRIIQELSLALKQPIIIGKTLIFFDEIQVVPAAYTSLRYFYEQVPEQAVVAASSLLGIATAEAGAPVGRVALLFVHPMTFIEFLAAVDDSELAAAIAFPESLQEATLQQAHRRGLRLFAYYCAIGGMPEAVARWVQTKNFYEVEDAHIKIAASYVKDFHTYAQPHEVKYIAALFESVPHQLGQRFKYKEVKGGYRKRDLAPCLEYLEASELTRRIYRNVIGAVPDTDFFKLSFVDIGLAQFIRGVNPDQWFFNAYETLTHNSAIVEAAIGQELYGYSKPQRWPRLEWWAGLKRGSEARVDYLFLQEGAGVPIDVVTGKNKTRRSMLIYLRVNKKVPFGIRFSEDRSSKKGIIYNYPLYAVATSFEDFKKRAKRFLES